MVVDNVHVLLLDVYKRQVDGAPYGYRLYFRQLEGIGQIQVAYEISIQCALLSLIHILCRWKNSFSRCGNGAGECDWYCMLCRKFTTQCNTY